MARKRASMREGPLAELFKATEAQKRQEDEEPEARRRRLRPVDPGDDPTTVEQIPQPPDPDPPPAARMAGSLPEPAPQLHRAQHSAAYAATIRVVGVGGAGLNAVNR